MNVLDLVKAVGVTSGFCKKADGRVVFTPGPLIFLYFFHKKYFEFNFNIFYTILGCLDDVSCNSTDGFAQAAKLAKSANAIVFVTGLSFPEEHEGTLIFIDFKLLLKQ